ncbi:MAG: PHP domain-containing protein, partial [Deltaproteobacteria bacterium]
MRRCQHRAHAAAAHDRCRARLPVRRCAPARARDPLERKGRDEPDQEPARGFRRIDRRRIKGEINRVSRPPACDYVELRCRSAFSFLEASANPEDLVAAAAERGHGALALADRDGLYGIPRFHAAARGLGLRPIVGAELRVQTDENGAANLLLLVETPRGYRNLARLITCGHARGAASFAQRAQVARSKRKLRAASASCAQRAQVSRSEPQASEDHRVGERRPSGKREALVTWPEVEEHAADLCALARGDERLTTALLDRARAHFPGRLWVDVSRHGRRDQERANRRAVDLASAARVPVVATGDVRHARAEGRMLTDALVCLREKTRLDRAGRLLAGNAEQHLHTREEIAERFADHPAWIHASRAIAERCAFTLENLGYRFPEFPIPPGETQASFLRILTEYGARRRYGAPVPARARRQLEHELAMIEKLDLAGYFLIVHDIVRFACEAPMLVQGRGSAANSAVCYALGITAVDPVAMNLLFERFLSEERGEWPDIDLDLPSGDQREKVIQYVFEKYGRHGAAMTAVVVTYRTRMAVREMGKVLGLGEDATQRLAALLESVEHPGDRGGERAVLREAGVDPAAPRIAALLDLVARVRGLPRHLGQHSGGIVIAAGRLDEVVPIEPAAMVDRRVVQWDKEDCADLGIIKIDLLGLGMLAALEDTLEQVRVHEGVIVDLAKLPPDDPATYAMIRRADTIGTFQIESRAQMATLPRMKPERFYDLVVEVAIIRPGPITGKMVNPYLNRRAGREPVSYP